MNTTDTLLADLADVLDRASKLAGELSVTLAGPPVDMLAIPDDPLREYRLPGGRVAYETTYAEEVRIGDWVQRCHGDPEWHQVKDVQWLEPRLVRITYDGLAHEWGDLNAIRIARPAADVIAAQDKTA